MSTVAGGVGWVVESAESTDNCQCYDDVCYFLCDDKAGETCTMNVVK